MVPIRVSCLRWLAAFAIGLATSPCHAQAMEKISIVIFSAPSLGAFMPPVIKAKKLDQANGLDISFQERTPDAYTAQFNSGEFKVGGSASLLTIALADSRGVKIKYLFNLFDFWGAVVTSRAERCPRGCKGISFRRVSTRSIASKPPTKKSSGRSFRSIAGAGISMRCPADSA